MKNNKVLKGLFSLSHNIRLYIPSTINIDKKINTDNYINEGLKLFGGWFGGCTSYKAIGSWLSKNNVVIEKITIIESYATSEQVEKNLKNVLEFGKRIKLELEQEAVSLEYDNKLYFI